MQFTRLASLVVFLLSLGFLAVAAPAAANTDLEVRAAGANDAQAIAIGNALAVKVNADIVVLVDLLAEANLDVAVFAAIFAKLTADIQVSVTAIVALKAAAAVQVDVIAQIYANIFLALFPVLEKVNAVPGVGAAYFPAIDVQLKALLAGLNVAVFGVLAVFARLTLSLNVLLLVNLNIFVNVLAILGPLWIVL